MGASTRQRSMSDSHMEGESASEVRYDLRFTFRTRECSQIM